MKRQNVAERRKNKRIDLKPSQASSRDGSTGACDSNVQKTRSGPLVRLENSGHPAALKNISRSGLAFVMDHAIPEMTLLDMTLELPSLPGETIDLYSISCQGAVVRCEPVTRCNSRHKWLVAVFFTEMSDTCRNSLDAYVNRRT